MTLASRYGHSEVVEALLAEKGAEINARETTAGNSAMALASRYGRLEIVQMLLERGADVNSRAGNGATPLMFA